MTSSLCRVVLDCNTYLQALISPRGPASRLLDCLAQGQAVLVISEFAFDELRNVTSETWFAAKYQLSPDEVEDFIVRVALFGERIEEIPHVFD